MRATFGRKGNAASAGSSQIDLAFHDMIQAGGLRRDDGLDDQLPLSFQTFLLHCLLYRLLRGHPDLLEELAHGDVEGVGFHIRDHMIASNRVNSKVDPALSVPATEAIANRA